MNEWIVMVGIFAAIWVDTTGPAGGTLAVTAVGFYMTCRILLDIRDKE